MIKRVEDPGKDWPQIWAIFVACLPGLTSGLIFTWSAPFVLVLINDKVNYNISEDEANLLPVLMPVGMMVSAIFFFKIHDIIGRKYTLVLLSLPHCIFWIITIFAKDIYSLYAARIIGGISDAILYSALPIYVGEIATPRVRGTWGNGQSFSFCLGFLTCYLTVQQTAYICISLPILSAVLFIWVPESPYYHVMKGQEEKARDSLKWLLRKENIESDFLQLQADVERQISETGTWADLVKISSNRKALISGTFLRLAQQLSGISIFETNIQFVFGKTSSALSPQVSGIIFSALLLIIITGIVPFLDKLGRKKSFIYSSLGCSICLLAEAAYFYLDEFQPEVNLSNIQWFPLVGLVVYLLAYGLGLGPLPSLMSSELFPASIKGKALSITSGVLGFLFAVSTFVFKMLNSSLGLYSPFFIFSICSLVSFVLSFYAIPETKGKTLEEIQQDLKMKNKKNIEKKLTPQV